MNKPHDQFIKNFEYDYYIEDDTLYVTILRNYHLHGSMNAIKLVLNEENNLKILNARYN